MKIALDTVIKDTDGNDVFISQGKPASVRALVLQALDLPKGDASVDQIQKNFAVIERIVAAEKEVDLSPEEITEIKSRMVVFSGSVAGAVFKILNG